MTRRGSRAFVVAGDQHTPMTVDHETAIDMLTVNPTELRRWVGGEPYALVCRPENVRRYGALAKHHGLKVLPSGQVRIDGYVICHRGEVAKYLDEGAKP